MKWALYKDLDECQELSKVNILYYFIIIKKYEIKYSSLISKVFYLILIYFDLLDVNVKLFYKNIKIKLIEFLYFIQ